MFRIRTVYVPDCEKANITCEPKSIAMTQLVTKTFVDRQAASRGKLGWLLWISWVRRLPQRVRACVVSRMRCRMLQILLKGKRQHETSPRTSDMIADSIPDSTSNEFVIESFHDNIAANLLAVVASNHSAGESSEDDQDDLFTNIGARGVFDYVIYSDHFDRLSHEQCLNESSAKFQRKRGWLLGGAGYEDTLDFDVSHAQENEFNLEQAIAETMDTLTQDAPCNAASSSRTDMPKGQVRLIASMPLITSDVPMQAKANSEGQPATVINQEEFVVEESQFDDEDARGFQPLHAVSEDLKKSRLTILGARTSKSNFKRKWQKVEDILKV